MKYYTCVRKTIDWGNMTLESFERVIRDQAWMETDKRIVDHWGREDPYSQFLERIKWWDSCFNTSYFEYRQKQKDIAKVNWEDMRGFEIIDGEDIPKLSGEYILAPTDDDDWLPPNLIDHLEGADQYEACYWGLVLGGCWYGRRNDTRSFAGESIENKGMGHNHCLRNFKDNKKIWATGHLLRNLNCKMIHDIYSYSVISAVSITNFVDMHKPEDMFSLFDYYMEGQHHAPAHSEWANKYLDMMRQLDSTVRPRKVML